jgi:hypothetical protein
MMRTSKMVVAAFAAAPWSAGVSIQPARNKG